MATIRTGRTTRTRSTTSGSDLARPDRAPPAAGPAPSADGARAAEPALGARRAALGQLPRAELRDLAECGWDA